MTLSNIKVGDRVARMGRDHAEIVEVVKVTKTQIHAGNEKFRIDNGLRTPYQKFTFTTIKPLTIELEREIRDASFKRRFIYNGTTPSLWRSATLEQMKAVNKIMGWEK